VAPLGGLRALGAGWTGGQYSLGRILLGLYLVVQCVALGRAAVVGGALEARTLLLALPTVAAVLFTVGAVTRLSALVIAAVVAVLARSNVSIAAAWWPSLLVVLLLHAIVPPSPYGAWSARGRVDPRGDWSMPAHAVAAAWIAACVLPGLSPFPLWAGVAIGVGTLAITPRGRVRVYLWWALAAFQIGRLLAGDSAPSPAVALFLLLFAFDPRWIPGRSPGRQDRFFYDGTCALCHGATRFLLAEDRTTTGFAFASLQGSTWSSTIPEATRRAVPDSVAVSVEGSGEVLVRSTATAYFLERLGGLWRVVALALRLIPRPLRDAGYDVVAALRYRIFGRADALCPILPPDLRTRFLD
jgi:predicted DCC family thiol-disulfide oxidoreductase YuxK